MLYKKYGLPGIMTECHVPGRPAEIDMMSGYAAA